MQKEIRFVFPAIFWILFVESMQSNQNFGFYLISSFIAVFTSFLAPFSRSFLNVFVGIVLAFLTISLWYLRILYFSIPFFIILFILLYAFSKK